MVDRGNTHPGRAARSAGSVSGWLRSGPTVAVGGSSSVTVEVAGKVIDVTLDRPRLIVDVNLILRRNDKVLLGRRRNTSFGEGCYNPPAGHLELGESVTIAMTREAKEELGIDIAPRALRFVQVMHNSYGLGRIAFFFEAIEWRGEPTIMEPDKCDDLRWAELTRLPDEMLPHVRFALERYAEGERFSLYGW